MEQSDFVKGALIGGCIGGLLAIFVAPKSGKQLRKDMADNYHMVQDQAYEYFDEAKEQAHMVMDTIKGVDHDDDSHSFLIGSASGAIVGALAGLLLAPQSGDELREHLGEAYDDIYNKAQSVAKTVQKKESVLEDKLEEWKDVFYTIIEKLSSSPKSLKKEAAAGIRSAKKNVNSGLEDILEWADLGMRFYNQFKR